MSLDSKVSSAVGTARRDRVRDVRQGAEEGGPDGSADDEHGLAQGDDLGGAAIRLLDQELGRHVGGGGESDKCLQKAVPEDDEPLLGRAPCPVILSDASLRVADGTPTRYMKRKFWIRFTSRRDDLRYYRPMTCPETASRTSQDTGSRKVPGVEKGGGARNNQRNRRSHTVDGVVLVGSLDARQCGEGCVL